MAHKVEPKIDWDKTVKIMGDAALIDMGEFWPPNDVSPEQQAYIDSQPDKAEPKGRPF